MRRRKIGRNDRQQQPGKATQAGQHDGLDQELHQHLVRNRADGKADADLPRSFGYRNQHDIHDADPADQQADRGNATDQGRQRLGRLGRRSADLARVENVEIIFPRRPDIRRSRSNDMMSFCTVAES